MNGMSVVPMSLPLCESMLLTHRLSEGIDTRPQVERDGLHEPIGGHDMAAPMACRTGTPSGLKPSRQ